MSVNFPKLIIPVIQAALVSVLFFGSVAIAENRIPVPSGVFYHRFAARVNVATSVWINPAALGNGQTSNLQLIYDYRDGEFKRDWGFSLSGNRMGYAYRKIDQSSFGLSDSVDYTEHTFALGIARDAKLSFGASYRYVKNGPELFNKRHSWNLSALYSQSRKVTIGAVISNLNRSKLNGEKSDFEQTYSVSVKPILRKILYINAEMSLSNLQNLSQAVYRLGFDYSPEPSWSIYGMWSDSREIQIGLRWNSERSYVGAQGRYGDYSNLTSVGSYVGMEGVR